MRVLLTPLLMFLIFSCDSNSGENVPLLDEPSARNYFPLVTGDTLLFEYYKYRMHPMQSWYQDGHAIWIVLSESENQNRVPILHIEEQIDAIEKYSDVNTQTEEAFSSSRQFTITVSDHVYIPYYSHEPLARWGSKNEPDTLKYETRNPDIHFSIREVHLVDGKGLIYARESDGPPKYVEVTTLTRIDSL